MISFTGRIEAGDDMSALVLEVADRKTGRRRPATSKDVEQAVGGKLASTIQIRRLVKKAAAAFESSSSVVNIVDQLDDIVREMEEII